MSFITVIPAKASSSRVPNKNFRAIYKDLSLVDITLQHTAQLKDQSLCILSTDFAHYSLSAYDNRYQIHSRPEHLSTKDSPVLSLLRLIVLQYNIAPETNILLLQPTSPFRTHTELSAINDLALNLKTSSLFSGYVTTDAHPYRMYKPLTKSFGNPCLVSPWHSDSICPSTQAQHLPTCLHRDGGFYLFSAADVMSNRLYNRRILCFIRPQSLSINIDEPIDFVIAQSLLNLTSASAESLLEITSI